MCISVPFVTMLSLRGVWCVSGLLAFVVGLPLGCYLLYHIAVRLWEKLVLDFRDMHSATEKSRPFPQFGI